MTGLGRKAWHQSTYERLLEKVAAYEERKDAGLYAVLARLAPDLLRSVV
jgi:hypothetical protein